MSLDWIDTHAHIEYEYPFSVDEFLKQAKDVGVKTFVTIGTDQASFKPIQELANKYSEIYFTVGMHPHEAKDMTDAVEAEMRERAADPKCVAIGEIGLDYYYNHSTKEQQQDACKRQLALALDLKKPVVIHARDAEADLLVLFADHAKKAAAIPEIQGRIGIIHCFSGTRHFAEECLKLGFFISISGIVTFKTAQDLRDTVRDVPLDKLLLETDSPFLAPIPFRGRPNQSAYMVETAKVVAAQKGISLAELSKATVQNSKFIFGI